MHSDEWFAKFNAHQNLLLDIRFERSAIEIIEILNGIDPLKKLQVHAAKPKMFAYYTLPGL